MAASPSSAAPSTASELPSARLLTTPSNGAGTVQATRHPLSNSLDDLSSRVAPGGACGATSVDVGVGFELALGLAMNTLLPTTSLRFTTILAIASSFALAACGGGSTPDTTSSSTTGGAGGEGGAAGAGGMGGSQTQPPSNTAGTYNHEIVVDGLDRELIVYVPESAVGAEPVPVVMMFHGTS